MNTAALIDELVSLPVEERALVAESVLQSLNQPDSSIDKIWSELAHERLKEIQTGKVEAVDGENVFEKILKQFE